MLQVKTKIGQSTIHGTGLFADQFIPKGTIIWKYTSNVDREYTEDEYNKLEGLEKEYVKIYSFKFDGLYCLCCDDARFFNHSIEPNCDELVNDIKFGYTVAARDIEIGEELTTDYNNFGLIDSDKEFNLDI